MNTTTYLHHLRVFLSQGVTVETLAEYLNDVFEDGYMNRVEKDVLEEIAEHTDDVTQNYVSIDPKAKSLAKKVLDGRVNTFDKYRRYLSARAPRQLLQAMPMQCEDRADSVHISLNDIQELENGAAILFLTIIDSGIWQNIEIPIPNNEGRYPDGAISGYRKSFSLFIERRLALTVLEDAVEKSGNVVAKDKLRLAIEGVRRMQKKPGDGHGCQSNFDLNLAIEEAFIQSSIKASAPERVIGGLQFKGDIDEATASAISDELSQYPPHIFEPLRLDKHQTRINIYRKDQLFESALNKGVLFDAPVGNIAFTSDYTILRTIDPIEMALSPLKSEILIASDRTSPLAHELFHALSSIETPRAMNFPFMEPYGVARLYKEAISRVRYYDEEAMSTTYQGASAAEYFADGAVVYYNGSSCYGGEGSHGELAREDPLLFLMFAQMDAILKYQYEHPECEKKTPPFWAAFTETARALSETYMMQYGDEWNSEENLAYFQDETLNMDVADEIKFLNTFYGMANDYPIGAKEKYKQELSHLAQIMTERCPTWSMPKQVYEGINKISLPR